MSVARHLALPPFRSMYGNTYAVGHLRHPTPYNIEFTNPPHLVTRTPPSRLTASPTAEEGSESSRDRSDEADSGVAATREIAPPTKQLTLWANPKAAGARRGELLVTMFGMAPLRPTVMAAATRI